MISSPMATSSPSCCSRLPRSFFFCKFTTPCCTNGSIDSPSSLSTGSYSRRWYNPLKRSRWYDASPAMVRHWIEADQPFASEERFTVATYNILGDRNAWKHRDLYSNVPSTYIKWDRRKRLICEELINQNPDIICLQEVDKYFDLSDILVKAGYVGSYKRRTGDTVDGCAMFWKAEKFRLLDEESIEFKRFNLRDNVAQLCVFEISKGDSRRFLIGNTHILYNPSRGDVKLGQIRLLLSGAQVLSEKWSNAPFVLAGDFNSTPQSAIYKFLSTSELNVMLYDRRELSGQKYCHPVEVLGAKKEPNKIFASRTDEEVKAATGDPDCHLVAHPFKLSSSYAAVKNSSTTQIGSGEPLATSFHSKFLGTVDYLWYTDGLVPTRILDTIPIDILQRIGGLPCQNVGSDHLSLVSEFAFTQGAEEGR